MKVVCIEASLSLCVWRRERASLILIKIAERIVERLWHFGGVICPFGFSLIELLYWYLFECEAGVVERGVRLAAFRSPDRVLFSVNFAFFLLSLLSIIKCVIRVCFRMLL